jgi:hypothetical protein
MYDLFCMFVFHANRVRVARNVSRQFAKRGL